MAKPKTSGGRGYTYEARFCMWCFVRGFTRDVKNFKLEYQVTTAGKFDDVIFHENGENYQLIQLKHKEMNNKNMKITHPYLFNETIKGDYNLLKYVKAFVEANSNGSIFEGKIKNAFVYTNIDFNLDNGRLNLTQNQWDSTLESLQIVECQTIQYNKSIINFDMLSTEKYYTFANNNDLFQMLCGQAEITAQNIRKKNKTHEEENKFATFCESFLEREIEIRVALDHIIYAVAQPNDVELEKRIKKEIEKKFKFNDVENLYNKLEKNFTDWCNYKVFNNKLTEIISYKDAEMFFNKNLKKIWFEVPSLTKSFIRRDIELEQIKKKLEEKGEIASMSGLSGIGKTETVRQFIKDFQDVFYGRVIWISGVDDRSLEKDFRRLGDKFDITKCDTKNIIDEVFDYFTGLKVLFVFDNYDKEDDLEDYVSYCRKSQENKESRPYFLFTSRDKGCLLDVKPIHLGVLSEEQTVEMIRNQLADSKIQYDGKIAKALAKTLQFFPLALQQAIDYIKKQSLISKKYGMENYIQEFITKKADFLSTFNINFNKIQKFEMCVKILKLLAYLYADEIDVSMFFEYFGEQMCVLNAIEYLERYCLITKIEEKGDKFYQINRLVQTVVQIKFSSEQNEIIEETIRLIASEAFEQFTSKRFRIKNFLSLNDQQYLDSIKKCELKNAIHASNILTYVKANPELDKKFGQLLEDICQGSLMNVLFSDDVNKIETYNVSAELLRERMFENMDELIKRKCNNTIKYLLKLGDNSSDEETVVHYATYPNGEAFQLKNHVLLL